MGCEPKLFLIVLGGFASGLLLGFIFRFSNAERDDAIRRGHRAGFLRRLYGTPIWHPQALLLLVPMLALMVFLLWAPNALLGILPLCGPDFRTHHTAFAIGAVVGAVLRWLVWKLYLRGKWTSYPRI